MKKVVILVEDKLYPLEDMLLNIQSILCIASKKRMNNAPENHDTEICVLHVLGDSNEEDKEHFFRIQQVLEKREQDIKKVKEILIPELDYRYESIQIDKEAYPENREACADIIRNKIANICDGREFVIILDVVLHDKKDPQIDLSQKMTLAQILYESFHENCIPYTHYNNGGALFRTNWSNSVTPPRIPYERQCMDGNGIYKPFRDDIYRILKIGDQCK